MSHLADGVLRRAMDEPFAISDADRAHLTACQRCRQGMEAARADRDAVAVLLVPPQPTPGEPDQVELDQVELDQAELDQAWARLAPRLAEDPTLSAGPATGTPVTIRPAARSRFRVRRPALAMGVAALVVVGTTAAAAAANWLPIFHPSSVTAVQFQPEDLATLPDLSAYGTLSAPQDWQPEQVADAATARARTGVDVPSPGRLPTGVEGRPSYGVLPRANAEFTFSADKARAAASRQGQPLPPMPSGIDGSKLRLEVGPGVVETWQQKGTIPALTVVRMAAPTVSSEGVSLATLENYLLAQPGIPPALAAQLRQLPVNGSVLPIPVPSNYATSTSTTVGGAPATLLKLRDESGAALIWIRDGQLNAVLGMLSPAELRTIASHLG